MQGVVSEGHEAWLHIEVGTKLVPTHLAVGAHHQVGPAAAARTRRLAPPSPVPTHHQAPEQAALAGAGGGGADRIRGVRGVPEIGKHAQTALLQIGGLRVFILVDDVFVAAFLHQSPGFGLHPGAHKRGQIQPCVAIQHQVGMNQLIGHIPGHTVLPESLARQVVRQVGGAGACPQLAAQSRVGPLRTSGATEAPGIQREAGSHGHGEPDQGCLHDQPGTPSPPWRRKTDPSRPQGRLPAP